MLIFDYISGNEPTSISYANCGLSMFVILFFQNPTNKVLRVCCVFLFCFCVFFGGEGNTLYKFFFYWHSIYDTLG